VSYVNADLSKEEFCFFTNFVSNYLGNKTEFATQGNDVEPVIDVHRV